VRLSRETVDKLPLNVRRYRYARDAQKVGIVHFGLGAFARAHIAVFTGMCMSEGERDWAISGVSLRSDTVARQLNPQDGLFILTRRSHAMAEHRLIGSIREVLVGGPDRDAIVARLASPDCHIASLTVTEKGYARQDHGALDIGLADKSFYPLLAESLAQRKAAGLPGLTLMSCDNLHENGATLRQLFAEYLDQRMPDLRAWFERECTCPNSMVDRIVPATTAEDLDNLERAIGMRDEAAVFSERFYQWVIEDRFAGPRPGWAKVGPQLVADVAPYETAKLRMLNGAHSALAYCGLERGYTFVHQAIADPELRLLVNQLMLDEAAESFRPAEGQKLQAYATELVTRFSDPALNHRLAQISMDGSQKIPQRWLSTLSANQRKSRTCPALVYALGAWMRHIRGDGHPVSDPMAARLAELWRSHGKQGIAAALFGKDGLFAADWQADDKILAELTQLLGE
jgi:fructuronate reductase